ncbi:hypothetical protein [Lactobacillus ultunensis]|nr:hypothetical protein H4B44_01560 [Lactobacillus ultunensis]
MFYDQEFKYRNLEKYIEYYNDKKLTPIEYWSQSLIS